MTTVVPLPEEEWRRRVTVSDCFRLLLGHVGSQRLSGLMYRKPDRNRSDRAPESRPPRRLTAGPGQVHDKCMAVKTITIDLEAYELLARRKAAGQSFSQVIKAHFGRQPTVASFRALIGTVRVSPDALDAMDAQVRRRGSEPARAVKR